MPQSPASSATSVRLRIGVREMTSASNTDGQFFYWGMDDVYDVFAAFTFTLESGFPTEALDMVLRSVPLLDKKVGEMALLIGR